MAESVQDLFIEALEQPEDHRNVDPIATLFADDAEIGNVVAGERFHGTEGARSFWTKYRDTFEAVRSVFSTRTQQGDRIVLEWTTTGSSQDHRKISYESVSLFEVENGKIRRFRAYFDSASLGRQLGLSSTTEGNQES